MQKEKSSLDREKLEQLQAKVKAQEKEILELREELVSTTVDMQKQKRELELTVENLKLAQSQLIQSEKMASVGVLTAGIAHELNNPINLDAVTFASAMDWLKLMMYGIARYNKIATRNIP